MKDIMGIMKKAQEMQGKMAEVQAELESDEITGSSGGGLVDVTLNGKGMMVRLKIEPSLFGESDPTLIEDLILAAHNDAKEKVEIHMQEKMQSLTAGLGLPDGMKLPF